MVVHASSCIYMYLYDQNTKHHLFEMNFVSLKLSIYMNLLKKNLIKNKMMVHSTQHTLILKCDITNLHRLVNRKKKRQHNSKQI
jgi:hypothetical protein